MKGRIIKGVGGLYEVLAQEDGKSYVCRPRGRFRGKITPLPGDLVVFEPAKPEGVIDEILPRENDLIRPAMANVSQCYLVFSLVSPNLNFDLLNHFLLTMENKSIKPLLLFNKKDLAPADLIKKVEDLLIGTGYEYHFISALEEVPELLQERLAGELTVLSGPSGAGKSTLLNNLLGEEIMATGAISEKIARGKHTTRHTQLIQVAGDGLLADTPGFSNVAPPKVEISELQDLFPEFRPHLGQCRFNGCLHFKEPGCAIKEQVGQTISELRYNYYTNLLKHRQEEEKYKWD